MVVISRVFSRGCGGLRAAKVLRHAVRGTSSTTAQDSVQELQNKILKQKVEQKNTILDRYRFIYPEFLPDPDPTYRNTMREKLERMDMLTRRTHIAIPEFYVGSVLAVTYSEPHAPGKVNNFVGICIEREGSGLRAKFMLRNMIDNQGIEVLYELYDPAIQKIECLRLERRLDPHLRYLRDSPAEYSTFPSDMKPEILPEGAPVPVNMIKIQLNPRPWLEKWEQQQLKGVADLTSQLSQRRIERAKVAAKPWEKYNLMKTYRETIPEEDQKEIFSEIYTKLHQMEITRRRQKHKRSFVRPQKAG